MKPKEPVACRPRSWRSFQGGPRRRQEARKPGKGENATCAYPDLL